MGGLRVARKAGLRREMPAALESNNSAKSEDLFFTAILDA